MQRADMNLFMTEWNELSDLLAEQVKALRKRGLETGRRDYRILPQYRKKKQYVGNVWRII